MAFRPPETILHYRVLNRIGEGSFGVVHKAWHDGLQRWAAIKFLLPDRETNPALVRRFFKEAQAASRIRHPNIVQIYDVGQCEDGTSYIVMEYLVGQTLRQRLDQVDCLSLAETIEIAVQLGDALVATHEKGIVHRDLKPENLFLESASVDRSRFSLKVLDFGIAKIRHREDSNSTLRTGLGIGMGTLNYVSPEQLKGAPNVDQRADIYSFGAVVYEMLSGNPPYQASGQYELAAMHLESRPAPLPNVPSQIQAAVLKALAREPEERFPSATQFVEALFGSDVAPHLTRTRPVHALAQQSLSPSSQDPDTAIETVALAPTLLVPTSSTLPRTEILPNQESVSPRAPAPQNVLPQERKSLVSSWSSRPPRFLYYIALVLVLAGTAVVAGGRAMKALDRWRGRTPAPPDAAQPSRPVRQSGQAFPAPQGLSGPLPQVDSGQETALVALTHENLPTVSTAAQVVKSNPASRRLAPDNKTPPAGRRLSQDPLLTGKVVFLGQQFRTEESAKRDLKEKQRCFVNRPGCDHDSLIAAGVQFCIKHGTSGYSILATTPGGLTVDQVKQIRQCGHDAKFCPTKGNNVPYPGKGANFPKGPCDYVEPF